MRIICEKCKKEYKDLEKRKCNCGGIIKPTKGKKGDNFWTEEKLLNGFRRFLKENGHFPTATEVDECNYLPAARSIQRTFGGLIGLRTRLSLGDVDLSKGEHFSLIAKQFNKISRESENTFYEYLKNIFGEPFVHREKPITNDYKFRYDFYIYAKSGNFGIDVFLPRDIKNLAKCLNIKFSKILLLKDFHEPIYIINLNEEINQESIDVLLRNKKNLVPDCAQVMNKDRFISTILIPTKIKPYQLV